MEKVGLTSHTREPGIWEEQDILEFNRYSQTKELDSQIVFYKPLLQSSKCLDAQSSSDEPPNQPTGVKACSYSLTDHRCPHREANAALSTLGAIPHTTNAMKRMIIKTSSSARVLVDRAANSDAICKDVLSARAIAGGGLEMEMEMVADSWDVMLGAEDWVEGMG